MIQVQHWGCTWNSRRCVFWAKEEGLGGALQTHTAAAAANAMQDD
jgi:hypothetical protein